MAKVLKLDGASRDTSAMKRNAHVRLFESWHRFILQDSVTPMRGAGVTSRGCVQGGGVISRFSSVGLSMLEATVGWSVSND